jgi:cytochrome c peroxidase
MPTRRPYAMASLLVLGLAFFACDRADRDLEPDAELASHSSGEANEIALAPGYGPLAFDAPEPGSYALPPLGDAADGNLLGSDGSPVALHELIGDKVAILSLMYSSCSDVNGCPLAMAVLHQIASRMEKDPDLADGLRLLSLSFDPARDTPEVMAEHASHHAAHGVDWRFLTTASQSELRPILDAYGQSLILGFDDEGNELGDISHVLRVFLIDPSRRIRNIYSVSYLHADTLVADVRTLLIEARVDESQARTVSLADPPSPTTRPGDPKTGYDRLDYETRSLGLESRRGEPADLMGRATAGQLGLPNLSAPADNPLTPEKVALGRRLFYDRRLSLNSTLSCAMCHVPEQGFASNELATAVGIEGRTVRRNTPTILNVGFSSILFHDGRENRLEHQVWGPLLARNEMGNASIGSVIERVRGIDDYEALFSRAFPQRGLAIETLGMAIASYERTLMAGDSRFDRWYFGKDEHALDDEAKRGFELFSGRAGCIGCHGMTERHALFMDDRLHNTGIGYRASMFDEADDRRVQIAPGEAVSVDADLIAQVSEPVPDDLGLYEITEDPDDRWKYKTPSLRNVALTGPYMHDGSLATLRDVVDYYDRGGVANELLDPRIRPLDLTALEKADLVAFLESLTGGDVERLVSDGHAAPVGDVSAVALHERDSRSVMQR